MVDDFRSSSCFWRLLMPVMAGLLLGAAPRDDAAHRLTSTEQQRAARLAAQARAAAQLKAAQVRAETLAREKIEAAARLRGVESAVAEAAGRLEAASRAQDAAARQVRQREAAIAAMLPVVLRLSRYPAETILAAPVPPDRALEGLLAAKGLAAQLAAEIRALHAEQAALDGQTRRVTQRQASLSAEQARQNAAAAVLDRQLAQTRATASAADIREQDAARDVAALAAQAANLRDAIAAMDVAERQQARARHAAPAGPGLALAAGHAPVAGAILRGWGAPAEDGPATGITFAATPGAFVSSPCTGKIAFAAPFRSYGRLMIVECGRGYDFVLAGLDRLDAPVGHGVRKGEPVGRMPGQAAGKPGLYLELRLNGRPVDPAPFLNAKA